MLPIGVKKFRERMMEKYGQDPETRCVTEDPNAPRIISEQELDELTDGLPERWRNELDWAFLAFEIALSRVPHVTESWRDLVQLFRETSGPRPATVIRKTNGGVVFSDALVDSCSFPYPELRFALRNLVDALDAIANFDPAKLLSKRVLTEAKRAAAKHSADVRHDGPNGKRAAKERIREIWASGKYESRELCAEEECAFLGLSFSTARKALRGTPDPLAAAGTG